MMKPLQVIAGCIAVFSCNSNSESNSSEAENPDSPVQCYSYANTRDTILLKVIPIGETVTGTLVYLLDGKDRNTGTIEGVMRDNLLVADYTFISEGVRSVRQVAFLKKDSFYVEGYGEIVTTEKGTQFSNTDSLWYNDSIRLSPKNCQD
jgi:hypothetical protein